MTHSQSEKLGLKMLTSAFGKGSEPVDTGMSIENFILVSVADSLYKLGLCLKDLLFSRPYRLGLLGSLGLLWVGVIE